MAAPFHPRGLRGSASLALRVLALPAALVVFSFTVRRFVFALAALHATADEPRENVALPDVTLFVPARNEESTVHAALDALDRLDYPGERLTIVFVDDASSDSTGLILDAWCEARAHAQVLHLPSPVGKYEALNIGIRSTPPTSIVAVCDADVRPRPSWLRSLAYPFAAHGVGAVAGYLSPVNADDGTVSRYAAVEAWVHQLVTSAGKDALGLDPPTLGACAYRRTALDQVGLFGSSVSGEDVRISAALTRAGWRIRFVEGAVADNSVVRTWRDYWHQHLRWARNVFASAPAAVAVPWARRGSVAQRVESRLAAAGYADRVALLLVVGAARARVLPRSVPIGYGIVAAAEVVVAVTKAGHVRRLPRFLMATFALFGVDVLASTAASLAHALRLPRTWRQPRRFPT